MQNQKSPYFLLLIVFFLLFSCKEKENALGPNDLETLTKLIMSEEDTDTYEEIKNKFINVPEDSLKNASTFEISYYFYKQGDSSRFREWNQFSYDSSKKLKYKTGIAESYWDLGNFFFREQFMDSSYYNYNLAYEEYLLAGEELKAGRMLLNMAILQEKVKNYIGSENTTFQALDLIESSTDSKKYIYAANNNLGIIYNELGDYPQALEFHRKALDNAEMLKDPVKLGQSLNNLGVVHEKLKDYNTSIANYTRALSIDSLYEENTVLYAMLTDNLGYSEFKLGNYSVACNKFHKALKMRDSIEHEAGIVINKLHLGEYYLEMGDTAQARRHTREANSLAKTTENNRDLLVSYRLLSQINPRKAPTYLDSYIQLNDSLLQEERSIHNKFARIRYETDQFIQKADHLSEQKTTLVVGFILVLILFFLTYIIQRQNANNKKLILEKQQQDSNEKIYDLLLRSQQKYEEGSITERKRISRDLHDSILSKFFGVRLNLEVLNDKTGQDSENKRALYLENLKGIENEIREISHKLNADYDFSEIGFLDILGDLFQEIEETDDVEINFITGRNINWSDIRNNIKVNFYRIIQEALQNIRKHAKAQNVEIKIELGKSHLILEIGDNGQGFDVKNREKGIGLKNISERVSEIHGKFDLNSGNNGTVLKVSIARENI